MVRLECFVVLAFIQEGKGKKIWHTKKSLTLPLNEEESRRL